MNIPNEEDAVGYYMKVTLVTGAKCEGTVFTYNPAGGILVLIQNIQEQPSMKMIRTPYIKEHELVAEPPTNSAMPVQLDHFATLPSIHVGRDKSIFKHASSQLKQAENERMRHLGDIAPGTPIAACDAFVKIARIYPDVKWKNEEMVIHVTDNVIVVGDPDWKSPKALLVEGAPDKEMSLVDRIQMALAKSKK